MARSSAEPFQAPRRQLRTKPPQYTKESPTILLPQGIELFRTLHGKALPAGLIGRLVQTAWEQPMYALKGLTARSKGLAIHKAVAQFVANIERAGRESGVDDVLKGADIDFAAYDDQPVQQIADVERPVNRFRAARFAFPEEYRLRMEVGTHVVAEL